MTSRLLYLFTRTPLHVGAGSSVGAIDQPIVRERHTGLPIIPASGLKGPFAEHWPSSFPQHKRFKTHKDSNDKLIVDAVSECAWLFGSDEAGDSLSAAGALLFGEARLLAFPIRSAKGSYAWITSPLLLRRAARDGVVPGLKPDGTPDPDYLPIVEPGDEAAIWSGATLDLGGQIVLEEYTFKPAKNGAANVVFPSKLAAALEKLIGADPVWKDIASRLVILSDGMMSFFATTACEVAQHVRINDETGTAATHGLFNQENVPSETLFYAVVRATGSRLKGAAFAGQNITYQPLTPPGQPKPPPVTKLAVDLTDAEALATFEAKLVETKVFQFGADASTGLGYCSVKIGEPKGA